MQFSIQNRVQLTPHPRIVKARVMVGHRQQGNILGSVLQGILEHLDVVDARLVEPYCGKNRTKWEMSV